MSDKAGAGMTRQEGGRKTAPAMDLFKGDEEELEPGNRWPPLRPYRPSDFIYDPIPDSD